MDKPLIPEYGQSTLAEVLPSVACAMGAPGTWTNQLGLPEASRYVVFLVDGLGTFQVSKRSDVAPRLANLVSRSRSITSGAPSTTATSISSLGTGLAPGEHGIAGYAFRNPFDGSFLNALLWADGLSPLDVQPRLTMFERLVAAGVSASIVVPQRFQGTGLTESALRGAHFLGVPVEEDVERRIELTVDASSAHGRSLVYVYERELDHTGHGLGWQSSEWEEQLSRIEGIIWSLREALPDDVRLVVTGDHGMMDVPDTRRLIIEEEHDLAAELTLVAGEGRFRQVYTDNPDAVAARWRDRLGDSAWVRTRTEAIDEGWFGPIGPGMAKRFGDVVAAMRSDMALMTSTQPREFTLVGMHGSLTAEEMTVPLLVL